jgi:hypothetical protein
MRNITEEDILFLKALQNELLTQETDCQADPRFWVVREHKKEWGIAEGYEDGYSLVDIDNDFEPVGDTLDKAKIYVADHCDDQIYQDDIEKCETIDDLYNLIKENNIDGYDLFYYRDTCPIVENTMFLTKKSCQKHIAQNSYHYEKPHTYAMTAWRNPEMDRLLDILKNVNWEQCEK